LDLVPAFPTVTWGRDELRAGDMWSSNSLIAWLLIRSGHSADVIAQHYPAISWTGSYCRDVDAIGAWYAGSGDPGWAARRGRAVALLAEADRLAALAELVGIAALPGHERVVLLGGRLLREAVLQQNSLSANDAYLAPGAQGPGSAALIEATAAYRAALAAAVTHAAVEAANRTVDAEISATSRRLRAIADRWVPRLEAALRDVTERLEETERAESVRLRWSSRRAQVS
jgi:V/A-type H+-transporting ATPase subunit A